MSAVREVSEWHAARENDLGPAVERLEDAVRDLVAATGIPDLMKRLMDSLVR